VNKGKKVHGRKRHLIRLDGSAPWGLALGSRGPLRRRSGRSPTRRLPACRRCARSNDRVTGLVSKGAGHRMTPCTSSFVFPAKLRFIAARPAGFEPAAGGLEVPRGVSVGVYLGPKTRINARFSLTPYRPARTRTGIHWRSNWRSTPNAVCRLRSEPGSKEPFEFLHDDVLDVVADVVD
jgi:hypothetical protein